MNLPLKIRPTLLKMATLLCGLAVVFLAFNSNTIWAQNGDNKQADDTSQNDENRNNSGYNKNPIAVYQSWAAFRDSDKNNCYAIGQPEEILGDMVNKPYISISFWPKKGIKGQFYARASRAISPGSARILWIDGREFLLTGSGGHIWAKDSAMDQTIINALRSARVMRIRGIDRNGNNISDRYPLSGLASAIDAAHMKCL